MAEKKKGFDLASKLGSAPDVSNLNTSEPPKGYLAFTYADIADIHRDPYNPKVFPLSELAGLMDLILLEGGLQQPLYVEPEGEGWLIKSGHRRHAALEALVKGTDKQPPHPELRSVPVVYRPDANTEALGLVADDLDDAQQAKLLRLLAETRVLIGNMANRQPTAAQLAVAAQEMEAHYVAMAELGYRFPGRLRDQVAQACNTSASKLAKLKVIREKLVPVKFMKMFQADELKEDPAYVLARMPRFLQEAIARYKGKLPSAEHLRRIHDKGMEHYLATPITCASGEGCTNGENFLRHDLAASYHWDVGDCVCCVKCSQVKSCKYACPEGKRVAEKKKAKEAKEKEISEKKLEAAQNARFNFVEGIAKRVLTACEGKTEVFKAVTDELAEQGMCCEWNLRHAVNSVAKGEALSDRGGYMGYHLFLPNWLAAFCRRVNVSADYILGLAEDPMTQLAVEADRPVATPAWRPMEQPPEKPGRYLLKFSVDGVTMVEVMEYEADPCGWVWPGSGNSLDKDVALLAWYPIPEDEEVEDDG